MLTLASCSKHHWSNTVTLILLLKRSRVHQNHPQETMNILSNHLTTSPLLSMNMNNYQTNVWEQTNSTYCMKWPHCTSRFLPLVWVCQIASAIPHRAGYTKNTTIWSGWGLQNKRAMIQERLASAAENGQNRQSNACQQFIRTTFKLLKGEKLI